MTSREIIDGVITSINAQIARRKATAEGSKKVAVEIGDDEMITVYNAQIQILERIEKDLIQVEMNAKISYMGINTD
jgi:hypothetical protein